MQRPDVSAIVVSWNTGGMLRRCLQSLAMAVDGEAASLAADTWVVDNGSTDGSPEMVASLFPHVRLISNPANLGFARAANQALAQASGRYFLLLNSDAQLLPGALGALLRYSDANEGVAIVGPQLVNPDRSIQPSRRRFPTLATGFFESTQLQRFFPKAGSIRHYYMEDIPPHAAQEVDWLVGACLLVRREAVEQVGPLDEGFFLYSEELDWCRRMKADGWKVVYLPEAKVLHHYGQSSRRDYVARDTHFNDSKVRYFRKYHGPIAALLLGSFILTNDVFRLAEEAIKWLILPASRPLRQERISLILAILARRLRFPGSPSGPT